MLALGGGLHCLSAVCHWHNWKPHHNLCTSSGNHHQCNFISVSLISFFLIFLDDVRYSPISSVPTAKSPDLIMPGRAGSLGPRVLSLQSTSYCLSGPNMMNDDGGVADSAGYDEDDVDHFMCISVFQPWL